MLSFLVNMKVLVINGPNLNVLGKREPSVYGLVSLDEICEQLKSIATKHNIQTECFQSNHEGDIIEKILKSQDVDGIIINAGAFTHTSIAIRDALLSVHVPFIEVHISNIFKREEFRHKSYLSDIAVGLISGLGVYSYICALNYFINTYNDSSRP